jgi:GR25 family glycosyltransferase involved in LPS biosynthesis
MARGPIGIVLSHLSILQDALDSGYETIWVMEDDIQVIRDPHEISKLIEKLDQKVGKTWDILYTDRDTRNKAGKYVPANNYAKRFTKRKEIGQFIQTGARYGAYSMIIRRNGMKKILDFIKKYKIFLPYDLDIYMSESLKLYTVSEDVVISDPQALSDNGTPSYLKKTMSPS